MTGLKAHTSLKDYQAFVDELYGPNNRRHFTVEEMLTNISRFTMRGMKGIRKGDSEKIKLNMTIALSWSISLLSQLSIDLEENVWRRFPFSNGCHACNKIPCACDYNFVINFKS